MKGIRVEGTFFSLLICQLSFDLNASLFGFSFYYDKRTLVPFLLPADTQAAEVQMKYWYVFDFYYKAFSSLVLFDTR